MGDVTNISYYFDPSRTGSDSPVGDNSFIDVITTPFQGTFTVAEVLSDTEFRFQLDKEPERLNAEVGTDPFDNVYSYYSTTSVRAVGPINTIKLVSAGGFYQKLPIISDIASFRQVEKVVVNDGGTEYAVGVYNGVPIGGDGEGGLVQITVSDGTGSTSTVIAEGPSPLSFTVGTASTLYIHWSIDSLCNIATNCGVTQIIGKTAAVPGCTDTAATNYNPLANVDDGSCAYPVTCVATAPYTESFSSGILPVGTCTGGWASSVVSGDGWRFTGNPWEILRNPKEILRNP